MIEIIRCPSCEGYGWAEDALEGTAGECDWCAGIGYVARENDLDRALRPDEAEDPAIAARLEQLEAERLRGLGYTGQASKPWERE